MAALIMCGSAVYSTNAHFNSNQLFSITIIDLQHFYKIRQLFLFFFQNRMAKTNPFPLFLSKFTAWLALNSNRNHPKSALGPHESGHHSNTTLSLTSRFTFGSFGLVPAGPQCSNLSSHRIGHSTSCRLSRTSLHTAHYALQVDECVRQGVYNKSKEQKGRKKKGRWWIRGVEKCQTIQRNKKKTPER